MKSNVFEPISNENFKSDRWLILYLNDELSFEKLLNSLVVKPTIRKNKSNKALPDELKELFKSERKKCSESFKIQEKLDECMKLNVFEPMGKLSDRWLILYLNDELRFKKLLNSLVVTETPTIRRNKSNKALTDEAKEHFKSERKKCNESFRIDKLKEKFEECIKLTAELYSNAL